MANAYISRETAGSLYRTSLIQKGITDHRLLEGMVEDFLRTQYDNGPGIEAYPSSGSSAYNAGNTKATPAAPSGPPPQSGYNPLEGKPSGVPFFNPLGGGSANPGVSLNSVPPAATMPPNPRLRGSAGQDTLQGGGGFDPLPQTSGHTDIASRSGQESMSPAQAALLEKLMAAQRMA